VSASDRFREGGGGKCPGRENVRILRNATRVRRGDGRRPVGRTLYGVSGCDEARNCHGGGGGGQQGTEVRGRGRRGSGRGGVEEVVDVGRRERALREDGVARLRDERRDVVELVLVGARLPTPAPDVVLDVVETLHRRVHHSARHTNTTASPAVAR